MSLDNSQYDAIMRHYEEVRERHRHEQEERIARIYREIPEVKELDDRVASESVASARRRLSGDEADSQAYHQMIQEIGQRRAALLAGHGYPPDYLELHYDCPICHDTGYVGNRRCECFQKEATRLLYRQYSPGDILKAENFAHFSFDWYSATIRDDSTQRTEKELARDAYSAARLFSASVGKPGNNLYLYGNTGTGKTFLTHCIAGDALSHGFSVLYFTSEDFFDLMAASAFGHDSGSVSVARTLSSCDVLILDDLGTELTNSFTASQLFQTVNDRLLKNKSTVISTNLSPGDLADRYNERVLSRIISNYKIKKLVGKDIRIRKKLSERG